MLTAVEKVLFLRGIDLFSALSSEDLAEIALVAEEVHHEAGDLILREGEHGDVLYFVLDGRVAVRRGTHLVAELGAREIFGEMALLDPGPRTADVEALSEVTLLGIGRDDFNDIMRERPAVPIGIVKVLVRRLREAIGTRR